ncbi:putative SP-containing membrane protein [Vairimorpha necatrix]|uniref:SP-containing membrane protein n=1 Tax=Vairimorpha necatrix TaxID=6039 RepID=A0AAX4JCP6_9MICR
MKLFKCSFLSSYIIFCITNTDDNVSKLLHSMVNSNLTRNQTCDSLNNNVGGSGQSVETIKAFSKLFWETIINHDIFKRLTKNNTATSFFVDIRALLQDRYLELVKQAFKLTKWDPDLLLYFPSSEKIFTYDLVGGTLDYYNMLRLCYKDTINNSNSTQEAIKQIFIENTCFIPKGLSDIIPSTVFKMCKGLRPYYDECYGNRSTLLFLEDVKKNQEKLSTAECMTNLYDFKNITTAINNTTENIRFEYLNMSEDQSTNFYGWFGSIFGVGIIIFCLVFILSGYLYYKKNNEKRSAAFKTYKLVEMEKNKA